MELEKGLTVGELAIHYRITESVMDYRIRALGVKKLKYDKPRKYYLTEIKEAIKEKDIKIAQKKIDTEQAAKDRVIKRAERRRHLRIDKCPNETISYLKRYYNFHNDGDFAKHIGTSRKSLWSMIKEDRVPKVYKLLVEEIKKKGE